MVSSEIEPSVIGARYPGRMRADLSGGAAAEPPHAVNFDRNRTIHHHHHQVTTSTTTVTAYQSDGALTIKRMKEMAEEQHHRNVELQAGNCQLASQLKQAQQQIADLKKAFKAERLGYSDVKSKQDRLDRHLEDFNGILEGIDIAHLKLGETTNRCQSQQEDFSSRLAKTLEEITRAQAQQKESVGRYLDLERRVSEVSDRVAQAREANREISGELVTSRALASEKADQERECRDRLEESRAQQARLEAELSEARARHEQESKQKAIETEVLKQELSRTVSSLNGYLELRQREHDEKVRAQTELSEERARWSRAEARTREALGAFEAKVAEAQAGRQRDAETMLSRCEGRVTAMARGVGRAAREVAGLRSRCDAQAKKLKQSEDLACTVNRQNDELTARVASVAADLEQASSKLVMKTSEAEMARKESQDLRRQLRATKEEQKQYCVALSNQNASELNKMKEKMKEEGEDLRRRLEEEERGREEEVGAWRAKHDQASKDLESAREGHRAEAEALRGELREARAEATRLREERARAAAPAAKPRQPAAAPARRKAARSKARQGTSPPPPPKPKRQPLVHEPRKPKAAKAKAGDFDLFGDDMLLDPYSF